MNNDDLNKNEKGLYEYRYPRPNVTADVVLFGIDDRELKVLLIQRGNTKEVFYKAWALPGGYYDLGKDESLEMTATRELLEETAIDYTYLEQLGTYSEDGRDPRGVVITTAFLGLSKTTQMGQFADGLECYDADWFTIEQLKEMEIAFDHIKIIEDGLQRLRNKIGYAAIGFNVVEEEFTMPELQRIYEVINGKSYDKRNFKKQMLARKNIITDKPIIEEVQGKVDNTGHLPAKLYKFVGEPNTVFQSTIF
jgi:8-oxo-dGTP diphosphatase